MDSERKDTGQPAKLRRLVSAFSFPRDIFKYYTPLFSNSFPNHDAVDWGVNKQTNNATIHTTYGIPTTAYKRINDHGQEMPQSQTTDQQH